ncbi:MAG: LamG-like jellyroll fold domain-containing protein [Candidatus Paceibacterota bacterium]
MMIQRAFKARAIILALVIFTYTTFGLPLQAHAISDSVAHWSFDEAAGSVAADSTGNGLTAALSSSLWGTGQFSGGLDFSGSGGVASISSNDTIDFGANEDLSISFWFWDNTKSSKGSNGAEIVEKQQSNAFYQVRSPNKSGELRFQIDDGSNQDSFYSTTADLADGAWHHVVFIRDYDSGIFAYVDGVAAGSDTSVSVGSIANSADLQFGGGNAGLFDGGLDEVRIYNRVLSEAEVTQLFGGVTDETAPTTPTNLALTQTDQAVTLHWNGASDAETGINGYRIYRASSAGGVAVRIGEVSGSQTTYTDSETAPGATYWYQVAAVNGADIEGSVSNQASVTITDGPPEAPQNLVASAGNQSIQLNWAGNAELDLAGYSVYVASTVSGPYAFVANVTQNTFTHTSLINGQTYYYVVTAEDLGGNESGHSLEVSATPNDIDPSVVGWWKFDESNGVVALDSSENNNHGTLINSPQRVSGVSGNGLQYNASQEQSVHVAHDPSLNFGSSEFSISLWVKYTDSVDTDILRKGSTDTASDWYKIEVYSSSQRIEFNVNTSQQAKVTASAPFSSNDGEWHHVAAIRDNDAAAIILYIDGVEADRSSINPAGTITNSADLAIGSKDTLNDDFLNGTLDEVIIFNRKLSLTEIQALAQTLTEEPPTELNPPTGITGVVSAVTLNWLPSVQTVDHYIIKRDGVEIAQVSGLTYTDTIVQPGTTHSYTITAVSAAGVVSAPSDPLIFAVPMLVE